MKSISVKCTSLILLTLLPFNYVTLLSGADETTINNPRTELIAVLPDQLIQVRNHAIQGHKQDMARHALRSRIIGYGVQGVVAGAIAYCAWSTACFGIEWIQSWSKKEVCEPIAEQQSFSIEEIEKHFPYIVQGYNYVQKKMAQEKKTKEEPKPVAVTSEQSTFWLKDLVKAIGMQGVSMIGLGALSMVCKPYLDQLFFYDDLDWFITKKTHLEHAFKQLQQHATAFDSRRALPGYKVDHSVQALKDQLVDVVVQVELIVGFMEYLLEQATTKAQLIPQDLQDGPTIIIRVTNDFCAKLHNTLQAYAQGQEPAAITSDVSCFITDIKNNCDSYKYFEQRLEQAQELVTQ